MSTVSSVTSVPTTPPIKVAPQPAPLQGRAKDGDTQLQEAAESNATKHAERQGGGFAPAPNSTGAVNKIA